VSDSNAALDGLLELIADAVARRVVDRLRSNDDPDWVDQAKSPLGRRRHIAAVRSGELKGLRVGRRYIAHKRDLDAFVAALAETEPRAESTDDESVEEMAARLGLTLPRGSK
jgi:hypothetical protein